MRVVATLADGQSLMISVPSGLGEPSKALEISRIGDRLMLVRGEAAELVSSGN